VTALDPGRARLLAALRDLRDGNFRRRLPVTGADAELHAVVNELADRQQRLAGELRRVTDEATSGRRPVHPAVVGGAGGWEFAERALNELLDALVRPTDELVRVLGAVAEGDLGQRMSRRRGDIAPGKLGDVVGTVNDLLDQLSLFTSEVSRVAAEIGTEGRLGGQAHVPGLAGTWRDLADSVNRMAADLTGQVRDISQVAKAVAQGDLTRRIAVPVSGEMAELKDTINTMVDQLSAFADEVTRVAHEVGSEGRLGGQAQVPGAAGTWRGLTDSVNRMADNLTAQVRNISQVATAVARGDLSQKIDVDARGEILALKNTINTMVDQLSAFAGEVTRVAREVGTEGKLGGQAEVADVSGTWRRLTDSVNGLAGNLTTQVRAIAGVANAVTSGDLTRQITVAASGEVAELKDDINAMISNLAETTRANQEQDWLKTHLTRLSGLMQGRGDLGALASLIMTELVPLVSAQHGAFYLVRHEQDGVVLERTATYGAHAGLPERFELGESLVGQAALDRRTIVVRDAPPEYLRIASGLGESAPAGVVVLPVQFEDQVLAVLELAALRGFAEVHLDLLERLRDVIGVEVHTIVSNTRTEELLAESQHLARELRARSEQLERQQDELQRSNSELEDKAALLAARNRDIEIKNSEIEQARQQLEERARQLAQASAYKSEFLANMSHELRTPLNSSLILAKLLADNAEGNLTAEQVDLARTIHEAGSDLLALINDVLDLSKVESGYMAVLPEEVELADLARHLDALYRPPAEEQGLAFSVEVAEDAPGRVRTDQNRLEQILRNLLSNALKFTDEGSVALRIFRPEPAEVPAQLRGAPGVVAFSVQDTGIGVPEDKRQRIFEAFQQGDGTIVRRYGGTGLGLSISRELSELLGGTLHVDSEEGRGSVFTLYLPPAAPEGSGEAEMPQQRDAESAEVAAEAAGPAEFDGPAEVDGTVERSEPAPEPAAPPEIPAATARTDVEAHFDVTAEGIDPPMLDWESAPASLRAAAAGGEAEDGDRNGTGRRAPVPQFDGQKVLVVDDDPRSVYALTALLEQHGLRVSYVDNGIGALNALREEHDVAVVLMDVMMPELDGNSTIRTIRQMPRHRELPIIAVTAKAMQGDREESLACGADECVTKPVDAGRLLELLAERIGVQAAPG